MTEKNHSIRTEEVREFLERYLVYKKMLNGNRYARLYLGAESDADGNDEAFFRARMHAVRHFINHLPDCREKMLLYYRYLQGYPVEKCAEILEVSRRTAFRIAADALRLAADNFQEG